MEILTIFTNDKKIFDNFYNFICSYPKLIKDFKDKDTIYFVNPKTNKNEIYYHFLENNIEYDFLCNYDIEIQNKIKKYFNNDFFYFFDIQFRTEVFLQDMLKDFKMYLSELSDTKKKILIDHPHKRLIEF